MLPAAYYNLHAASNLISGFGFWGVAFAFSIFINRIKIKSEHTASSYEHWSSITKFSSLFTVLSSVFFFCGLGHIVEGIKLGMPVQFYDYIMIIHCCTASLGMVLLLLLYINLSK